jgi:hypothetical protein
MMKGGKIKMNKKVKMWQWIIQDTEGDYYMTDKFYTKDGINNLIIWMEIGDVGRPPIQRAEWTMIEVEK